MSRTDHVIRKYADAFKVHGRSSAAVLCPKGRHDLRFAALTAPFDLHGLKVLDFGCGLGHLCEFLDARGVACDYLGVDIVNEFVEDNSVTFPNRRFRRIRSIADVIEDVDVVIASGVFNLRYVEDAKENHEFIEETLRQLFARARVGLSVDFMTSHVDFERPDAFHIDPAWALDFAIRNLSRRVKVNHSYMPFEFSMSIMRAVSVDREAGRYV